MWNTGQQYIFLFPIGHMILQNLIILNLNSLKSVETWNSIVLPRHGLRDVCGVDCIVVRVRRVVRLLDEGEELPNDQRVETVITNKAVLLKWEKINMFLVLLNQFVHYWKFLNRNTPFRILFSFRTSNLTTRRLITISRIAKSNRILRKNVEHCCKVASTNETTLKSVIYWSNAKVF